MENMGYSWKVITSKDVNDLGYIILNDFFDYLKSNSEKVNKRYIYSGSYDYYYEILISNTMYKYNPDDYRDLCYELAIELYQYNLGISLYELLKEYNKEKKNIMHYLFLIFMKEIKREKENN